MSEKDISRYALSPLFGANNNALVNSVPHCRRLGVCVDHAGPHEATVRIPYSDDLVGDPSRGIVFGGVITTLMDQTLALATACSLEEITSLATLDLRIDYLRAAKPGLDLIGHARCYKLTPNVAFTRGVAYDADIDDPFAVAVGTFMLGANHSPSAIGRSLVAGEEGAETDAAADDGALPDETENALGSREPGR